MFGLQDWGCQTPVSEGVTMRFSGVRFVGVVTLLAGVAALTSCGGGSVEAEDAAASAGSADATESN